MNRTLGNAYDPRPRGSWKLKVVYAGSPGAKQEVQITDGAVYVQFDVCANHDFSSYLWLWSW